MVIKDCGELSWRGDDRRAAPGVRVLVKVLEFAVAVVVSEVPIDSAGDFRTDREGTDEVLDAVESVRHPPVDVDVDVDV